MKRGKDLRDSHGEPTKPELKEVPVLMFVMVEKAPGAFTLRLVSNEEVLSDIRMQGALDTFLADVDELYADFRGRFEEQTPKRLNLAPHERTCWCDEEDSDKLVRRVGFCFELGS